MPKIRAVGLMEWPVVNTKVKRKKRTNKRKKALKMSFFKISKNAFEFFFSFYPKDQLDQKLGFHDRSKSKYSRRQF